VASVVASGRVVECNQEAQLLCQEDRVLPVLLRKADDVLCCVALRSLEQEGGRAYRILLRVVDEVLAFR